MVSRGLKLFIFAFLSVVFCSFVVFIYFAKDLPRPEKFTEKQFIQSTKIYDRTGQTLLYEIYGEENRTIVSLDKIPDYLKKAVIATEDVDFYNHFGIDLKGILRSILINFRLKEALVGGSTIDQQLIRSTFFSTEKTAQRKIREIILAIELDRRYSKDQILEWYLNQVPFGSNAYGVEAASQTYFGKSVSDISISEAAVLAAIIQGPSRLSPFGPNKDDLLTRKDYVLDRMAEEGFLNKTETEELKEEEIKFVETPTDIKAPYFTLWVKQQLEDTYGEDFLRNGGLKVYTSLDWDIQKLAEKDLKEGVERNYSYNAYNGGLVAIDPKSGEVLAMSVGTGNYYEPSYPEGCIEGSTCLFESRFNVTVGTQKSPGRQPGSSFKPFIYATAFKTGWYDDETEVLDEPTNFGVWGDKTYSPQNYDGLSHGWVNLRQSLARSLNIPSIKVLYLAGSDARIEKLSINDFTGQESVFSQGLERSLKTARDMGITTLDNPLSSYGPALVLGGGEVNLLEMTSAYAVFANNGLEIPPVSILKIEDSQGNVIYQNKKEPKRVLSNEVTDLITSILSDNDARSPTFGPRSNLYFDNLKVAAKTGTTDDFRDCWTMGYTSSLAVGVWTGNNNNDEMIRRQPAATVAGPIFHQFMEDAMAELNGLNGHD